MKMVYLAYVVWFVTVVYSLVRLALDLDKGQALRKHLRNEYGNECCCLLQDKENRAGK